MCVYADWRGHLTVKIVSKTLASASFVSLALVNRALDTNYGCLIVAALSFSLIGDLLLLSIRSSFLLGGIALFFLAHLAFAAAFFLLPLSGKGLLFGLLFMSVFGAVMLRWLWPYLASFYRIAVPAYLIAIILMTSLAIAASFERGIALLGIAALVFAVSDISVARDRFVERSIINKIWGLPLYYTAQILFAISVLLHR